MIRLSHINIFSRDIAALSAFYANLFDFSEVEAMRSPIYRLLDCGASQLGFNALEAYALLDLSDLSEKKGAAFILNFEVTEESEVSAVSDRAVALGAKLVKPPYVTYYGRVQAVLLDPEFNVFRLNYVVQSS